QVLFVGQRERTSLHRERVGRKLRLDFLFDGGVQALHERDDGNDRRHGDDVADDRQERAQLVGPDGLQRNPDRLEELLHQRTMGEAVTVTGSPSRSSRTEANGPVMTSSPSSRPERTSKWRSPAMPVDTGTNTARPSRTAN